jgi:UMF1 family MFS transporter
MATETPHKTYRKIVNSSATYDGANSAFATTGMAAMLPPSYRSLVISAGSGGANATAFWAYTTSLALFLIAILAPVLGAISDHTGGKKRYIGFFAGLGIVSTTLQFGLCGGNGPGRDAGAQSVALRGYGSQKPIC